MPRISINAICQIFKLEEELFPGGVGSGTAVRDRDIILVAIPSHSFRDVLQQIKPFITSQAVISLDQGF